MRPSIFISGLHAPSKLKHMKGDIFLDKKVYEMGNSVYAEIWYIKYVSGRESGQSIPVRNV